MSKPNKSLPLKAKFRLLDKYAKKLGVYVSACGCCSSPWVIDNNTGDTIEGQSLGEDKKTKRQQVIEL